MLITKKNVRGIADEIEAALAAVGAKCGIKIQTGNMSLTQEGDTAKIQLHLRSVLTPAQKAEVEKERFVNSARNLGLVAEDFGAPFQLSGKTFRISGLHVRNVAKCVLIDDDAGKTFQVTPQEACQALHGTDWYFVK